MESAQPKGQSSSSNTTVLRQVSPGSSRWNEWQAELETMGLSKIEAYNALVRFCRVLKLSSAGAANNIQPITLLLKTTAGLSQTDALSMLIEHPELAVAKIATIDDALQWLKDVAAFQLSDFRLFLLSYPNALRFKQARCSNVGNCLQVWAWMDPQPGPVG